MEARGEGKPDPLDMVVESAASWVREKAGGKVTSESITAFASIYGDDYAFNRWASIMEKQCRELCGCSFDREGVDWADAPHPTDAMWSVIRDAAVDAISAVSHAFMKGERGRGRSWMKVLSDLVTDMLWNIASSIGEKLSFDVVVSGVDYLLAEEAAAILSSVMFSVAGMVESLGEDRKVYAARIMADINALQGAVRLPDVIQLVYERGWRVEG